MFRPRGFAPPRRFAPRVSCGSVAPRNRSRVHRVSCVPAGRSPEGGQDAGISSRGAFRTLRRVPLVSSRKRITAAVAFLSLPSCPVWGTGRSRSPSPTAIPADAGGVPPKNQPGEGRPRPEGRGADPNGRGIQAPKSPGGPGPGTGRRGSEEHRHRGPARWVRGSEEPRACLGGVGGSCRTGRGRTDSEEPGIRSRGDGGGRRSEEHRRRVPGTGRGGSEEPPRPGRSGSEEPRRPRSRRGGSAGPKTGGPASMAGVHSVGSGGSGGAGTGRRGSEEPRRRARNDRGPSPKAGDGVRGGDPDAMMLRSAEADPHIIEHTPRAGAEAPVVVA
jgi:hypothetical protein